MVEDDWIDTKRGCRCRVSPEGVSIERGCFERERGFERVDVRLTRPNVLCSIGFQRGLYSYMRWYITP